MLCVFLVTVFCITTSEAKIVEKILAMVNDDIITKTELDERLLNNLAMLRQLQYDEARLAEEMEKAKPEILELMIDELLFTQEAVRVRIQVADERVQQDINKFKEQYGSSEAFEQALKAEGYTLESFKKDRKRIILFQLLIEQTFGPELRVTDEEVKQFYKESMEQSSDGSDVVKLKRIFVKFHITDADAEKTLKRAKDIVKQCREGADFGEMAAKFSDHKGTRESGGDMGYFVPGMRKYAPNLEEAASQLAVGKISDVIKSPGGYDIIKVTDIKDDQIKAQRIYIAVCPEPASESATVEKANSILKELENGADFVDMVEKYSDDPLAKDKGGDWEDVSINAMSPDLREAFESLEEGEISRPVRTPLGLHIFKIVEKNDSQSLADLTDDQMKQIREFLHQKRLAEKLSEYSKKLREKAYIQKLAKD
jgi:peptidyl-prolyl cis-trans isomerase SurA